MRTLHLLLVLLLCITLNGCANFQSKPDIGLPPINQSNSNGSYQRELEQLKIKLSNSKNQDLKNEIRQSNLDQFTSGLVALLNMQDSIKIKDSELSNKFDETVFASTKAVVLEGGKFNIRVVNFQAPLGLKGTLEGKYTVIQWWNDEQHVHAQLVVNEDSEIVRDFVIRTYNDKIELLLGGYLSLYSPKPVFVSSWELDNQKWTEKKHSFTSAISSNDFWDLSIEDNTLIVENQQYIEMNIEISEHTNGFVITSDKDASVTVQFSGKGVEIRQALKSFNVDGAEQQKIDINQYAIDNGQSFTTHLKGWGKVKFVSTVRNTNGLDQACFFLLDSKEHILYSFPVFNGNSRGTLKAIKGVSFKDVNLDGYTDIAIIGEYITGDGTEGVTPFPVAGIYFQQSDHIASSHGSNWMRRSTGKGTTGRFMM
jgi:hypothetical protein